MHSQNFRLRRSDRPSLKKCGLWLLQAELYGCRNYGGGVGSSRYGNYGLAVVDEAGNSGGLGVSSPSSWRSQLCHAFAEPSGYQRSQEDTKKIHFEYRRNLEDTRGHERTRHDAGSGP
jgi:hypothetical protein